MYAQFLGFDLSTTALSCGVRSVDGKEDFVSIPMQGKTMWNGQPAHDLDFVSGMILEALNKLEAMGWSFASTDGALSLSVRQHDMVLLGSENELLMPALSWQCVVAKAETNRLNSMPEIVSTVGKIEWRFILPKLLWVFRKDKNIAKKVARVMTTGDYIAAYLTGQFRLSTSDGLSNGLLGQKDKRVPIRALVGVYNLEADGQKAFWALFPQPIQSGKLVGRVSNGLHPVETCQAAEWLRIGIKLAGWQVISSLGDNHAGGVGCGLADDNTIVISAGSSGTVIRKCKPSAKLAGKAACFEYYDDRLLLLMLADCADWYSKFASWYSDNPNMAELDQLAMSASPGELQFWPATKRKSILKSTRRRTQNLVASAQFSIAVELLLLVRSMLKEARGKIDNFVLTGGLSRSVFFRRVMGIGLNLLKRDTEIFVSNRSGPLASQAATLGAMINAMVGSGAYEDLLSAISALCPQRPILDANPSSLLALRAVIRRALKDN